SLGSNMSQTAQLKLFKIFARQQYEPDCSAEAF
ncbi:MAG: hypothetical protein ACI892_001198, partial [Marinobacter maritimus]